MPGQGEEPLESRVAALERQVQELERQVQQLLSRPESFKAERLAASWKHYSTTGTLPKHLVSVQAFAELHRIPEQKVLTHIDIRA